MYPLLSDTRESRLIFYGKPKAFPNYLNVVKAFPLTIWAILCLVTVSFIVLFCVILKVYKDLLGHQELVKDGINEIDIVLKVVSTLTEPDAFDIFPLWSTGRQHLIKT